MSELINKALNWPITQYNAFFKREKRPVEGIFYKIKDVQRRTQGYLLGTLHVQIDAPLVLDKKIMKAFEKAKKLLVELPFHTLMPGAELQKKADEGCIDIQLIINALEKHKEIDSLENIQQ